MAASKEAMLSILTGIEANQQTRSRPAEESRESSSAAPTPLLPLFLSQSASPSLSAPGSNDEQKGQAEASTLQQNGGGLSKILKQCYDHINQAKVDLHYYASPDAPITRLIAYYQKHHRITLNCSDADKKQHFKSHINDRIKCFEYVIGCINAAIKSGDVGEIDKAYVYLEIDLNCHEAEKLTPAKKVEVRPPAQDNKSGRYQRMRIKDALYHYTSDVLREMLSKNYFLFKKGYSGTGSARKENFYINEIIDPFKAFLAEVANGDKNGLGNNKNHPLNISEEQCQRLRNTRDNCAIQVKMAEQTNEKRLEQRRRLERNKNEILAGVELFHQLKTLFIELQPTMALLRQTQDSFTLERTVVETNHKAYDAFILQQQRHTKAITSYKDILTRHGIKFNTHLHTIIQEEEKYITTHAFRFICLREEIYELIDSLELDEATLEFKFFGFKQAAEIYGKQVAFHEKLVNALIKRYDKPKSAAAALSSHKPVDKSEEERAKEERRLRKQINDRKAQFISYPTIEAFRQSEAGKAALESQKKREALIAMIQKEKSTRDETLTRSLAATQIIDPAYFAARSKTVQDILSRNKSICEKLKQLYNGRNYSYTDLVSLITSLEKQGVDIHIHTGKTVGDHGKLVIGALSPELDAMLGRMPDRRKIKIGVWMNDNKDVYYKDEMLQQLTYWFYQAGFTLEALRLEPTDVNSKFFDWVENQEMRDPDSDNEPEEALMAVPTSSCSSASISSASSSSSSSSSCSSPASSCSSSSNSYASSSSPLLTSSFASMSSSTSTAPEGVRRVPSTP